MGMGLMESVELFHGKFVWLLASSDQCIDRSLLFLLGSVELLLMSFELLILCLRVKLFPEAAVAVQPSLWPELFCLTWILS